MTARKDPHAVLGVSRGASEEEVRLAYRRLARKHHPDCNPNDTTAQARFTEVRQAYEQLQPSKRSQHANSHGFDPHFAETFDFNDLMSAIFGHAASQSRRALLPWSRLTKAEISTSPPP